MRMVYCKFRLIGFHSYPDPPKEVSYLQFLHRHEFHFKVGVEVSHDDREIEFHMLKRFCIAKLRLMYSRSMNVDREFVFGHKSCEMIADELMVEFIKDKIYDKMDSKVDTSGYSWRQISIEVSEDGENGAIVTRL